MFHEQLINDQSTGKGQFLSQFQRRTMLKNVRTTIQLCSSCSHGNAQNPSSQASVVHESRTSRCSSWIQKSLQNLERIQKPSKSPDLETREQISNICWIIEKARELPKIIYLCSIDYAKAFDCVDHSKLQNILKEMEIPDHLI